MRNGDMSLLAVNKSSGDFYFRKPNGGVCFMCCFDDMTLQNATEKEVETAVKEREFGDFRDDPNYAFESLVSMKSAVQGIVSAYQKNALRRRQRPTI